jgi:hypothetical protein
LLEAEELLTLSFANTGFENSFFESTESVNFFKSEAQEILQLTEYLKFQINSFIKNIDQKLE